MKIIFEGEPYFRDEASGNVRALLFNRAVIVAPHTTETFLSALELYRGRLDKGYSLTDCISMQIMRRESLTEALTSDRHFEQEDSGLCSDRQLPSGDGSTALSTSALLI